MEGAIQPQNDTHTQCSHTDTFRTHTIPLLSSRHFKRKKKNQTSKTEKQVGECCVTPGLPTQVRKLRTYNTRSVHTVHHPDSPPPFFLLI
jgi:hypothetical protein